MTSLQINTAVFDEIQSSVHRLSDLGITGSFTDIINQALKIWVSRQLDYVEKTKGLEQERREGDEDCHGRRLQRRESIKGEDKPAKTPLIDPMMLIGDTTGEDEPAMDWGLK
tara:strand:+ start:194 stop:529 length:336 start_codon:yes stop_codon:yes gene_type:complete